MGETCDQASAVVRCCVCGRHNPVSTDASLNALSLRPAHLDSGRVSEHTPVHQQQHLPMEVNQALVDAAPVQSMQVCYMLNVVCVRAKVMLSENPPGTCGCRACATKTHSYDVR